MIDFAYRKHTKSDNKTQWAKIWLMDIIKVELYTKSFLHCSLDPSFWIFTVQAESDSSCSWLVIDNQLYIAMKLPFK